jgi:hypothetical protein
MRTACDRGNKIKIMVDKGNKIGFVVELKSQKPKVSIRSILPLTLLGLLQLVTKIFCS